MDLILGKSFGHLSWGKANEIAVWKESQSMQECRKLYDACSGNVGGSCI